VIRSLTLRCRGLNIAGAGGRLDSVGGYLRYSSRSS
jgi:hypothetical protein